MYGEKINLFLFIILISSEYRWRTRILLIKPVMFGFITNCFKNLKLINIYLKYSKLTESE